MSYVSHKGFQAVSRKVQAPPGWGEAITGSEVEA